MITGITGHQDLGNSNKVFDISKALKRIFTEEQITFGYTSLAIGADQLFAEILLEAECPYCAVIPSKGYENTFKDEKSLKNYKTLLQYADQKKVLSFDYPEEKAFYEAGKYIIESSDLLVAIWDGNPARGLGGTGDIVEYGISLKKKIIQIHPVSLEINHL